MMPMKKGFEPMRGRSDYRDMKEAAYMPPPRHTLAQEMIDEAIQQGHEVQEVRDPGFLEDHALSLAKLRAEAHDLMKRLEYMADRVFGTEPGEVAGEGPKQQADCNARQLADLTSDIVCQLSIARYHMGRLEKL